jgi:hypothetical protein|tara:strand:- start:1495 stop:1698 length:204 start_codon:yes stop_codon:yes gene_type:complete
MMVIQWFTDWRDYQILPFGSDRLLDEPAYVYDVIRHASTVIREIEADAAKRQKAEMERAMKRSRSRG